MKKTIKEMVAEQKRGIRERASKDRAELRTLEALAKALPDVKPDRVHVYRLYGTEAELTFGDKFVSYGQEDSRLTMSDVALLLDAFPPVKTWRIKDGCTAMRPDWDVKDSEVMREDSDKAIDHWGPMLKVEPGTNSGGANQSVEWFTERQGLRLRIQCILKPEQYPAQVDIRAKRAFGKGQITRIEDTMIQPRGSFWLDQRVKWAQGSSQHAHTFTCYWTGIDNSQGDGKAWLEQVCGENFPPKGGHFQA